MLCRTLLMFLVLAAPVLSASLTGSKEESDDAEASVKNSEDEAAGEKEQPWPKSFLYGSNLASIFDKSDLDKATGDKEASANPSSQGPSSDSKGDASQAGASAETPAPRHLGQLPHETYPGAHPQVSQPHPQGHPENLWAQPSFYQYPAKEAHYYEDPYWLLDQGYGYPYGGPVSPYPYTSSGYCPPCHCKDSHEDKDHDEGYEHEEEDEDEDDYHDDKEDYEEDEYYRKDYYGYPSPHVYHPEESYSQFYFDPTVRYDQYDLLRGKAAAAAAVSEKSEAVDSASQHRSKRSVEAMDAFDWYTAGTPSKFLERHNVGYRIKNHLRERLRSEYFPLHYGHIRLGSGSSNGKHRQFGDYADFDAKSDAPAFGYVPKGPKLGKKWMKQGFPVYGYNLYKLKKTVYGKLVDKKFVTSLQDDGPHVPVKPGVYRMVMILDDARGLIVESVSNHRRYLLKHVLHHGSGLKTLSKFQAVAAWKDKGAKFFKVQIPEWGTAYVIRPSPLGGANPKVRIHHGGYAPKFQHLKFSSSLLKPESEKLKIKLKPKPVVVEPPLVVDPPVVDPPVVDPPAVDPPMVNPPTLDPPMVDPPIPGPTPPGFPDMMPMLPNVPRRRARAWTW